MTLPRVLLCLTLLGGAASSAQEAPDLPPQETTFAAPPQRAGPTRDVLYRVLWLIESDDANRREYAGPARDGLSRAGYGRLVPAGSATAMITIGQRSTVSGTSRYGEMSVLASLLNTAEQGQLQVEIELQTRNRSPLSIKTTAPAPIGRWFLVGGADSRVGLPQYADDGKRAVAVMRVDPAPLLLD